MDLVLVGSLVQAGTIQFGTGYEDWLRSELPEVPFYDLDSYSDKGYAAQLVTALQQADRVGFLIITTNSGTPLGSVSLVLEAWIRKEKDKLLLLQGTHAQLERIGNKQPAAFRQSNSVEEIRLGLQQFLSGPTGAR